MLQKKTAPAIFYLNRQRLSFYCNGLAEVHALLFSDEAVKDLDVQNRKTLERQLDNWLTQHNLSSSPALLLLGEDVYFAHDVAQTEVTPDHEEYQVFMGLVPLDDALIQTFPLTQGARLVAINRGFLQPIVEALTERGFTFLAITPSFVFGEQLAEREFDKEMASALVKQPEVFFAYNFLSKEQVAERQQSQETFMSVKFDKKILALIGVFVLLLGLLGGLIWWQNTQNQPQKPVVVTPAPAVAVPSPIPSPAQASATFFDEVSIQVRGVSFSEPVVGELLVQLGQGYAVATSAATADPPQRTTIVFASSVSAADRQSIIDIFDSLEIPHSLQENPSATVPVQVTLAEL